MLIYAVLINTVLIYAVLIYAVLIYAVLIYAVLIYAVLIYAVRHTEWQLLRLPGPAADTADHHATSRLVTPYAGVVNRKLVSLAGSASRSVGKRCHRAV